jgi:hypothetical protein
MNEYEKEVSEYLVEHGVNVDLSKIIYNYLKADIFTISYCGRLESSIER